MEYEQNKSGYIVFEDGGTCPIAYGASEKWLPTYDAAMKYAMGIVTKRIEELKGCVDYNSVIVYEGGEELMHKSHSCPCGRVVFEWRNYHRAYFAPKGIPYRYDQGTNTFEEIKD